MKTTRILVLAALVACLPAYAHDGDETPGQPGPICPAGPAGATGPQGATGAPGRPGPAGHAGKDGQGAALGLAASQVHPDYDFTGWQAGAGVAAYDGDTAVAIGIAHRACVRCGRALLNGSAGYSNGKAGAGVGINLRW